MTTPINLSLIHICEQLAVTAFAALEDAGVTIDDIPWVGIGTPGTVNRDLGVVEFSNNLYFNNFELRRMLQERMKKEVIVENDANAAAYGEYQAGALKDVYKRQPIKHTIDHLI